MNFSNRLRNRFLGKCVVINNLSNPSTKDFSRVLAFAKALFSFCFLAGEGEARNVLR